MSYFSSKETSCKDGCGMDITPQLRDHLDELRARFGAPLNITSAARCPKYNTYIGGAFTSQHQYGKAADISTANLTASERFRLVKIAIDMGIFTGIGIHNMFIHVDIGHKEKTIWSY